MATNKKILKIKKKNKPNSWIKNMKYLTLEA